ncbi:hypothetical protein DFH07DRAFT_771914 [Mycena maculata]|uniref:3'-5' exonuclease domain-containing protein n=1 Tax=Mycena maculata TaxID=230809 RepID=A0AAD7J9R1_9AGAR|nr:hypothetical protein DFH07DRAFT_771914 [Mycena maculata]
MKNSMGLSTPLLNQLESISQIQWWPFLMTQQRLKSLELPDTVSIQFLGISTLVESALYSVMTVLDDNPEAHLCISLDAEWNVSHRVGVSVHKFDRLPSSLLRLLVSNRVFKIGSSIKADFTRLKKQFSQLNNQTSFNAIDLKEYSLERGVIGRKESGSLDALTAKVLKVYLPKDDALRKTEEWETIPLCSSLLHYAALDASRLIFEEETEHAPPDWVHHDSSAGSPVALLVHEGGEVAVKPELILGLWSTLMLYSYPLLRRFCIFYHPQMASPASVPQRPEHMLLGASRLHSNLNNNPGPSEFCPLLSSVASESESDAENSDASDEQPGAQSAVDLQMLEAHHQASGGQSRGLKNLVGKKRRHCSTTDSESCITGALDNKLLSILQKLVDNPEEAQKVYTRILKDIFHAFHMIPIAINHGLHAAFLHALRDHIMRWNPTLHTKVDKVCREEYGVTFDVMLGRNPQYIKKRMPRHVPSPNILVPMIQHISNVFGNALDAETQQPLFNTVDGAESYSEWINGDLYERTNEKFGIVLFLRQGLPLPVLPPTTIEARKFFFTKVQAYAALELIADKLAVGVLDLQNVNTIPATLSIDLTANSALDFSDPLPNPIEPSPESNNDPDIQRQLRMTLL